MQTNIDPKYHNNKDVQVAESILRSCVHCGFCTATCPTYQELNDERDGPRGRIYLVKQYLEGGVVTENTRTHLDRCLTCRSCETTCPSGVQYGKLVDITRSMLEESHPRSAFEQFKRTMIRKVIPNAPLFGLILRLGQLVRPLLPGELKAKVPPREKAGPWPVSSHQRTMLVLNACAQPSAKPNTNAAAARVLDRLGITLKVMGSQGCCGAVNYHLGAHDDGKNEMRRNIDAWWPEIEKGAEAIVITASGCGAMVKEYGHILEDDPQYKEKAARITEMCKDLTEILLDEDLSSIVSKEAEGKKVSVHVPCTLQHAQKLPDNVDKVFAQAGFELAKTKERHLCCGSAGTYSILQPKMSKKLRDRKLKALTEDNPEVIVTANIGCHMHLESNSKVPVHHWIELLDQSISPSP